MVLAGLSKLTLLDYPSKVACTVFLGGCNFMCPFCHNAPLVTYPCESALNTDELLKFLKSRQGILEGVVITGGEPLINPQISKLLIKIKDLGYNIKIDTNGTNPKLLKELVEEKLVDRVAMDIKNSLALYPKTVGIDNLNTNKIEESVSFLLKGSIDYEFRTTVVKGLHTKESLIDLAKWICGAKEYYLQQFKNSGNLIDDNGLDAFSEEEMKNFAKALTPYVSAVKLRGI